MKKLEDFDYTGQCDLFGLEESQRDPWETVLEDFPEGTCTSGEVVFIADYGAFVELAPGLEGLLHNSELSWTDKDACAQNMFALGDQVEVVVTEVDPEKRRIRLSHRQTMPDPWDGVEERFPVGARIRGWVQGIAPYGAFIKIDDDDLTGLVHLSEMSWTRRVFKADDFLKIGQTVEVIVLDVDAKKHRISLSIKQATPNPFDELERRYPVGTIVRGKVVSMRAKLGAYVEIEPGVDALIHISQICERRISNVGTVLKIGQEVEARVVKVVRNKRGNCLLGLSMRKTDKKVLGKIPLIPPPARTLIDAYSSISNNDENHNVV